MRPIPRRSRDSGGLEFVPAHVGHAGRGGKAAMAPGNRPKPGFRRFFARFEQGLQAQADAEERNAGVDALEERVAHLMLIECAHHLAEMADAGQNDLVRALRSPADRAPVRIRAPISASVFWTDRRLPAP